MAQKQCNFFEKLFAGLGIFPADPKYERFQGQDQQPQEECRGFFDDFFSWLFQQEKPNYLKPPYENPPRG